jgi:hypothetical protein
VNWTRDVGASLLPTCARRAPPARRSAPGRRGGARWPHRRRARRLGLAADHGCQRRIVGATRRSGDLGGQRDQRGGQPRVDALGAIQATTVWLVNKCTSLRGSPMRAMPSWLRGTSLPVGEQQLGGVILAVQVRRAHRACAIDAFQVGFQAPGNDLGRYARRDGSWAGRLADRTPWATPTRSGISMAGTRGLARPPARPPPAGIRAAAVRASIPSPTRSRAAARTSPGTASLPGARRRPGAACARPG